MKDQHNYIALSTVAILRPRCSTCCSFISPFATMAADSIARGDEFFDKAQKKLKSFSFFGEGHCITALQLEQ